MTKPFSVPVSFILSILFACSAIPAFANHGGGGGGGFHGGGGGGGFHSSGGGGSRGGSYSAPAAGYRSPAPQRSGGGFAARPGNSYSRPSGNVAGGNQRYGNSYSAPAAVADGRWHSFASQGGGRGASGAQSAAGPASNAGGFHVFSGNRQAGSAGTVRSFSGQGGEVWENSPAAQNVVPRSQSLATLHNSFSGSAAAGTGLRSNSALSSSARVAGGSALVGNRGFSGGVNSATSFQQLRGGFNRFGGNSFGGFGRGCWNCGFGFGRFGGWGFGWGGWGFGWPWLGFGLWDPFWS